MLFADIRGFTRLCEGSAPGEVAGFLAEPAHAPRARSRRRVGSSTSSSATR
ncbi:hypothetical protein ACU4GA_29250 [Methylobacterium oryzae CBMB20]